MATILFYEKPGCSNNRRQKELLLGAGHELEVRSLLTEPWTADELRRFFGERPVAEWFNRAAPRVKSGEIDPASMTADAALALMLQEPLLIRRPLMQVGGERRVGFDLAEVDRWVGLDPARAVPQDLESCRKGHQEACAVPAEAPSL